MTEEVYKRPMFTMPAYRLFASYLYGLSVHTAAYLQRLEAACLRTCSKVINSGTCLCKAWLLRLLFFFVLRGNEGIKTAAASCLQSGQCRPLC